MKINEVYGKDIGISAFLLRKMQITWKKSKSTHSATVCIHFV
jgi:hypothetical protein